MIEVIHELNRWLARNGLGEAVVTIEFPGRPGDSFKAQSCLAREFEENRYVIPPPINAPLKNCTILGTKVRINP